MRNAQVTGYYYCTVITDFWYFWWPVKGNPRRVRCSVIHTMYSGECAKVDMKTKRGRCAAASPSSRCNCSFSGANIHRIQVALRNNKGKQVWPRAGQSVRKEGSRWGIETTDVDWTAIHATPSSRHHTTSHQSQRRTLPAS